MRPSAEIPACFAIAAIQLSLDGEPVIHVIMTALWVEGRDIENTAPSSPPLQPRG